MFIYPASIMNPNTISEFFVDRAIHPYLLLNQTTLKITGEKSSSVIYDGWMLSPYEYRKMVKLNPQLNFLTSPEQYKTAHQFYGWANKIRPHTIEFYEDIADYKDLEFNYFTNAPLFIKTQTKSAGTKSLVHNMIEFYDLLNYFDAYGYDHIEGLVFRKVVEVKEEIRLFSYLGNVYSRPGTPPEYTAIAVIVSEIMQLPFISIDVAMCDNVVKVVEIGDGQVSDLKEWTISDYKAIFND